jgi:phage tail sheath protein FI
MALWVSTTSAATRHAVYAIERTPPAIIQGIGTGIAGLVEQFPWGPPQTLYRPGDVNDRVLTFAPPGMSRLGSGYLAMIQKAFPDLHLVRVIGASATPAAVQVSDTAGTTWLVLVTLKYPGTAGNAATATVSPASDGDPTHRNIAVTVTGASGTTTDFLQNINLSGLGPDTIVDTTKLRLVGSVQKLATGLLGMATVAFSGGTDGGVIAADYVGSQGQNDRGLARLEADDAVSVVFFGDPGNAFRGACNQGVKQHCDVLGDRFGFVNGNPGQQASAAQADVANYRSTRVVYCDPWVYELDDTTGARQLVPSASFAGSICAQLSPSTKISWKNPEVIAMLSGIVDLEGERGQQASTNTAQGIATFIREKRGGFTIEADVVTIAPIDPSRKRLCRGRVGTYIAKSITESLRPNVDGPNVPLTQQGVIDAVETFMDGMKRAKDQDPAHRPYVLDYGLGNIQAANGASDQENGDFIIPLDAKTDPGMERIFLSVQFGEGVKRVTAQ